MRPVAGDRRSDRALPSRDDVAIREGAFVLHPWTPIDGGCRRARQRHTHRRDGHGSSDRSRDSDIATRE